MYLKVDAAICCPEVEVAQNSMIAAMRNELVLLHWQCCGKVYRKKWCLMEEPGSKERLCLLLLQSLSRMR